MKKLFLIIAIMLASLTMQAGQVIRKTANVKVERVTFKQGKDKNIGTAIDWCYQDRDGNHQIYRGDKGGMYYYKVAKSGKNAGEPVRRYVKKEDREKINNTNSKKQ